MTDIQQAKANSAYFTQLDNEFDNNLKAMQEIGHLAELGDENAQAAASLEKLNQEAAENAAMAMTFKNKNLRGETLAAKKTDRKPEVQESVLVRKEDADQFAGDFMNQGHNKQYHLTKDLLSDLAQELGIKITAEMSSNEIIDYIIARLHTHNHNKEPDSAQVDKAFEFLLYVTEKQLENLPKDDPKISSLKDVAAHIRSAKDVYCKANSKAIASAQNIIGLASGMSDKSGLSIKETLDPLREILSNSQIVPFQIVQDMRKKYEQEGGSKQLNEDVKNFYQYLGEKLQQVDLKKIDGEQLNQGTLLVLQPAQMLHLIQRAKAVTALIQVFKGFKVQVNICCDTLRRAGLIK